MSSSVSSVPASVRSPTWPLTTIFTPPASCLPPLVSWSTCTEWQIHNSVLLVCGPGTDANACLPTSFYSNSQTPTFSPGVCPHGYTIATTMTEGVAAVSVVPASLSQTTSLCCPSGLIYRPSIYTGIYNLGVCFTTLTVAGSSTSANLTFGNVGTITTDIFNLPQHTSPQTVVLGYQSPLTVVWASENLATFTPASAPLSVAAFATSASTSTTSTVSSSVHRENTGSGSLSTGAEVGIGVGVAIAAIIGLIALITCVLRRRRQNATTGKDQPFSEIHELDSAGQEYSELDAKRNPMELHSDQRYELPGSFDGHEVSNPTSELDGSSTPQK